MKQEAPQTRRSRLGIPAVHGGEHVNRYLGPSLSPATITGILDRLERGGWVARDRDATDRRAVVVRSLRDRTGELIGLYSGMNDSMDKVCAEYGEDQLELLADFLRRTAGAGRAATDELAGQ